MFKRLSFLLLALPVCPGSRAQQPAPALHFEVVDIREVQSAADGSYQMSYRDDPHSSHVEMGSYDAQALLRYAFRVDGFQIVNFPDSLPHAIYNLHLSAGEDADSAFRAMTAEKAGEARSQMLQEVMISRFHLKFHWATQEMRSVLLYAGKPNPQKLRPSAVKPEDADRTPIKDDPSAPFVDWQCGGTGCMVQARGKSMAWLAEWAMPYVELPVADRTGLPGLWDFTVRWIPPWMTHLSATATPDHDVYPVMEVALTEQLGLRTEHGKAPAKVLVVDHIEPPTPN